VHSTN